MLGPIGSEIMAIFRLLSPDAIDNYIVSEKVERLEGTMTASGEELNYDAQKQFIKKGEKEKNEEEEDDFDVEKQAKIIPLHKYKDQKDSHHRKEPEKVERESRRKSNGLDSLGILSAAEIREQEKKRLREESASEDSITVFLLKERAKMRQSKQKIMEQVAMKMYQSSAAVDLDIEQDFNAEEEVSSDMRGILVNKKQY